MKFFTPSRSNRRSIWALTLMELLITTGIASIAFAAIASLSMYSARSFVAMGNYADLDQASRNALDLMAREIRQTVGLTAFSPTRIVFTNADTRLLTYEYLPNQSVLIRRMTGEPERILLHQCDYLKFNISQRNPSNDFSFYPTTSVRLAKLVDVSWRCSRQILGTKANTESVQTAKIVIRN